MRKFTLPRDGGLIEAGLPNGIKHTYERIPAHILEDEEVASEVMAGKIADAINAAEGVFRLGLSTGSSPVSLYRDLVKLYQEGKVSSATSRSTPSMNIILHRLIIRAATAGFMKNLSQRSM